MRVHTQLEKPLEAGQTVHVTVDWARRFDHMQQHSAQHLLTSIAADFDEVAKRNAADPSVALALASVDHRLFLPLFFLSSSSSSPSLLNLQQ